MSESQLQSSYGSTDVVVDDATKLRSRTSLSSIIVGTLVAISAGVLLHLLGAAVGLMTIDAVDRDSPSATSMALMAGGWSLLTAVLSLGLGGYVAARLSGNTDRWDSALQGLGVWGVAVALSAALAGMVAAGSATVATNAAGSILAGAMRGAGTAAGAATDQVDLNALAQRVRSALSAPNDVAAMTTEQRGVEITAIIGRRVADGSFAPGQRERLSALTAAEAGISPAEADQRIAAYEQQAREAAARAEQRAREAADAAATAAAISAFWMFATLLIGAGAAVLGAVQGARDMIAVRVTSPRTRAY
ncbi:hypothetical protein GXW78_02905 [Roseomonas terrae]|uniref:PhnA-like protein n=1 Tax=Neoroseomonas terrae TaxID=424799 RepID=A0ABS5EC59_9PROT|nr:hypothetical protein [Neoroseomonas terrae]MBR0648599.1 hypothetical protein [Neoroseomonas terrae]